jgi:putative acetyltransferase
MMTSALTMIVRSEQPGDFAVTEALALAAFAPDVRVAELVRRLRASPALIPHLNLVAEINGVIAGHIMFSQAALTPGHEVALLSPLGVLPVYQRRGVGASLVYHALEWLKKSKFPVVVLEGVPAYYPRFGFTSAHEMGIEPPFPLPKEVWQAIRLPAYQRDAKGVVAYPEPFDFLYTSEEKHS